MRHHAVSQSVDHRLSDRAGPDNAYCYRTMFDFFGCQLPHILRGMPPLVSTKYGLMVPREGIGDV